MLFFSLYLKYKRLRTARSKKMLTKRLYKVKRLQINYLEGSRRKRRLIYLKRESVLIQLQKKLSFRIRLKRNSRNLLTVTLNSIKKTLNIKVNKR